MKIDGKIFRDLLTAGLERLREAENEINDINVFPVADQDTGSNMLHTLSQALLRSESSNHLGEFLNSLVLPLLEAAQGNAGLIISAYLISLAESLGHLDQVDAGVFAESLTKAAEDARTAVSNPLEGTILTVMNAFAQGVKQGVEENESFPDAFWHGLEIAQHELQNTRKILEVLRKANVLDAGALGFVKILEGMMSKLMEISPKIEVQATITDSGHVDELKTKLQQFGDSIVVVSANGLTKVHIHTPLPISVLRFLENYGMLVSVENSPLSNKDGTQE